MRGLVASKVTGASVDARRQPARPRVSFAKNSAGLYAPRFPLIVETLARLRSHSCIIDGEAVVCDDNGVASFDRIRHPAP